MSSVCSVNSALTSFFFFFFFNDTATTEIYTLSLHDALPIYVLLWRIHAPFWQWAVVSMLIGLGFTFFSGAVEAWRSEEHTSELQSQSNLVCRLLLEKKKKNIPTEGASYITQL